MESLLFTQHTPLSKQSGNLGVSGKAFRIETKKEEGRGEMIEVVVQDKAAKL